MGRRHTVQRTDSVGCGDSLLLVASVLEAEMAGRCCVVLGLAAPCQQTQKGSVGIAKRV